MPLIETPAIVLTRSRLGEADRLVTFFTRALGKMKAVARGARRPRSRFAAALEPFSLVALVLFVKKEDQLARVSQCDLSAPRRKLREDLEKLNGAAHLSSLVRSLTAEGDADRPLFDFFNEALDRLNASPFDRAFLLICRARILAFAGYSPTLTACVRCRRARWGRRVFFEPFAGGLLCDDCIEPASDSIFSLSRSAAMALDRGLGMPADKVDRIRLSAEDLASLEGILSAYEAVVLERPVPSGRLKPAAP